MSDQTISRSDTTSSTAPAPSDITVLRRVKRADQPHFHVHHHRDIQGGAARAAVFGISDGLVSNVSLIVAVAAAGATPATVRLAGLAGLLAGAISMAAGEYVSMRAQTELFERELSVERVSITDNPEIELRELAAIYRHKGVSADLATALAEEIHRDLDLAVETHAREELGVDPDSLGSPVRAAASSLGAFAAGAVMPLLPWFLISGGAGIAATVALGAVTAVLIGIALARFTARPPLRSALRQLAIATGAALVTYGLGSIAGAGMAT